MEERPHQADLVVARLPISAVVLDAAGVILDVSAGWKAFADEGGLRLPNHAVGANYLKYCVFTDKSSVELLSGLQQVLGHQIDCFGTAYPCHTSVRQRWFMMAAFPIVGSAGRAAVLHINITSLIQDVSDPSVIMLGRGPAAVDHAQNVMTKLIKRSVAETLSAFHFPVREPVHEATPADGRKIARLADRELRLLRLLATGATNSEIGKALAISSDAAKFRVIALTRRLGFKNRTQAAVFAAKNGLLD